MEYLIIILAVVLSIYFLYKRVHKKNPSCGKCEKCTALLLLLYSGVCVSQEVEKPFIIEHKLHKHRIDFVNATVYQQIKNYSAVYNTSHIFFTIDFTPDDEIFLNSSYTAGNGITKKTERLGYQITTTGDDLQDYLKDINNTGRKYLLELFYQKKMGRFIFIAGLIDAAAFVDSNSYANDEHTQFLNPVFINNPIALIPSYNFGGFLQYKHSENVSVSAVYIQNKPDNGNVGIVEIDLNKGSLTVRPYYYYLFGYREEKGFGLSSDVSLRDNFGLFFRGGFSTNNKQFLSGGFEIKNIFSDDKSGFAYGFLKDSGKTHICECYYTKQLNNHLYITADIQYIKERKGEIVYGGRVYLAY